MPARLFLLSALMCCSCATVTGYRDLKAELRSATSVALKVGSITVMESGRDYETFTLPVEKYKIELSREAGAIRYSTNVDTFGSLLGRFEQRPVSYSQGELDAMSPGTPLVWSNEVRLDMTNFNFNDSGTTTFTKHGLNVELVTTWANVRRVTAIEVVSAPMKWVLIGASIASYLAGAGIVALQLVEWKADRPVSVPLLAVGGGLVVLGVPLMIIGVKTGRPKTVSLYGENKGEEVKR